MKIKLSNGRLIVVSLLTVAMTAVFFVPILSLAAATTSGKYFKDVPDAYPLSATINALKDQKVITGYDDGTFLPNNSISRAEFLTLVMRSLNQNMTGSNCFKDVKTGDWFAPSVCYAKTKGIIKGYGNGTFKPDNNINFAEASTIIAKAYGLKINALKKNEAWFKPVVAALSAKKAIPVTIDYAEKKISRGETAEIIWRLKNKVTNKPTKLVASLVDPFPALSSCGEFKDKVATYAYQNSRNRYPMYMEESLMAPAPTGSMAKDTSAEGGGGAGEYSSTNVQVEGVDEADIIKNDGQYIYMISGRTVKIVKAFPPEDMAEMARYEFDDANFYPNEMYVEGDRLVVIGSTYADNTVSGLPIYRGSSRTEVYVLNVADKQNIQKERTIEVDGYSISSRKIGSKVYLIVNNSPNYYDIQPLLEKSASEVGKQLIPHVYDSKTGEDTPVSGCANVHFIPKYDTMNFVVVAGFDVSDPNSTLEKQTIMGAGSTVYASLESLYIAETRYDTPELQRFDVFAPPQSSNEKTLVYRFGLNEGTITYKGQGEVKGHLLNQFAMDESGSTFRLATTLGEVWNSQTPSKNYLFVLDKDNLGTVLGKIEDIAPGEKIYSVRFLGKRAYMVTFKKVDPFFVIGLDDPANPQILGALKIPGYSDYLHPYDENHIIGFGKEAVDPTELEQSGFNNNSFDFAWYQGMKIALFDVTDVANPTMMFKELIGDRGTNSELLYDHKALLYDKARNLFAFPVEVDELKPEDKVDPNHAGSAYGEPVFQGAYVYTLDLTNGFQLKGKIKHYDGDFPRTCSCPMIGGVPSNDCTSCYSNLSQNDVVKRIIYIGDYLYTISTGKVKAVKRDTMEEAKALKLEVDTRDGGGQIIY